MSFVRIVVYHASYGCDTGCCGHVIEKQDDSGKVLEHDFRFGHPYDEDFRTFAEDFVRSEFGEEHVADLDWDNCMVSDSC